jgi:hypothetical protein
LARDVVEQRMSHQWLEPLSPCSLPSPLATTHIPLGPLMEIQYASGAQPEKSWFLLRDVVSERISHH